MLRPADKAEKVAKLKFRGSNNGVAAALAPKFATAEDASTFLADADVTVESVDRRPVHYVESEESDDELEPITDGESSDGVT